MMYTTYKSIYERTAAKQKADQAKHRAAVIRRIRKLTLIFSLVIGVYFTFTSIVHAWAGDNGINASAESNVQQIIVMQGDTLWEIAESYLPADHKEDIRDYIKLIMKHNGMSTSNLMAGDVIEVPLLATE